MPSQAPPALPLPVRTVVLCCDGPYQRHLIRRAAETFHLVGVVLQHPPPSSRKGLLARSLPYLHPLRLWRFLDARRHLPPYDRRGEELLRQLFWHQGAPPALPTDIPLLHTDAINGPTAVAFLQEHQPDLVLVNGTQLLRAPILALRPAIRHGIVNLHTGLSPYSRGANCNLYMLMEGHPEMVGVTVHLIDAGIDSGDILRSAQVSLQPQDCFETIDVRSFHEGIELLLAAARDLVAGRARPVPQWEQGRLFLRRTGYHYEPWQRLATNRRIARGMLRDYLAHRPQRDAGIRLVGEPI